MASDAKTALLSDAGGAAIETATQTASKRYDSYENKHGHVDTKEEKDKLGEVLDGIDDRGLRWSIIFLDKLSKIIISVFSFVFLCTCGAFVIGFLGLFGGEIVWLIVILGITFGGSMLGSYGVYKYGALEEYLDKFEEENKKFGSEIETLKETSQELKKNVHGITKSVDSLQQNEEELNDTLGQFDDIRKQLQELVGDDGEMKDINDMVDSINNGYDSMTKIVINNRKAALLATYYGVAIRDGDTGLSKKEYARFLAKLDIASRKKFEAQGTFEQIAGDDQVIDLAEFQGLVDNIITQCDDEIMDIISKHAS